MKLKFSSNYQTYKRNKSKILLAFFYYVYKFEICEIRKIIHTKIFYYKELGISEIKCYSIIVIHLISLIFRLEILTF